MSKSTGTTQKDTQDALRRPDKDGAKIGQQLPNQGAQVKPLTGNKPGATKPTTKTK